MTTPTRRRSPVNGKKRALAPNGNGAVANGAHPAKAEAKAKAPPLLLDPKRLHYSLYLPNLIGYVRVVALLMAILDKDPTSVAAFRALVLSLALDYIDGPIARRLDMCTQFGDLLDHITDHLTMFYLVYLTSAWQANVAVNALHCVVALGYMAYHGCYFKHGGRPNTVCAIIEENNYFNMPSMLWNANTVLVPFVKLSYMHEYGLPLKSTTELVNLFDLLGLLVTGAYSIAVLVPGPPKADAGKKSH